VQVTIGKRCKIGGAAFLIFDLETIGMRYVLLFALPVFTHLVGCTKDDSVKVRYKVYCSGGCAVIYQSGIPSYETEVQGSWSKTMRIPFGEPYFLSATKTSVIGNVSIEVYLDGQLERSDESNLPYSTVQLEGVIPFP
jgi:hypothetical protein